MPASLKLAIGSLALFGFLALMAWTGKLAQIDGFKVQIFTFIVEDLAVDNLGRRNAAILFAVIGLVNCGVLAWPASPPATKGPAVITGLFQRLRSQIALEPPILDIGSAWLSKVRSNYELGDKPGIRTKFYGHEWEPADFVGPETPDDVFANMRRSGQGYALGREELPEAAAVWNENRFKRLGDIFWASGFMVVRDGLAEVLSRFDLGEGGLIPFPLYRADLVTPYPGNFFLLNFGCIKNSLLPDLCGDTRKWFVVKTTGLQMWHLNDLQPDAEVVLSQAAMAGADLWFEEAVHGVLFMSDALGQAIMDTGQGKVFDLLPCRVVQEQAG